MNIKFRLIFVVVFLSVFCSSIQAQMFFDDKERQEIMRILRQESNKSDFVQNRFKKNFEQFGLTPADTLVWRQTDAWIAALKGVSCAALNNRVRITSINWDDLNISGDIDLRPFEYLEMFSTTLGNIKSINLRSSSLRLKYLKCSYSNSLLELDLSYCTTLEELYCDYDGSLNRIYFPYNSKLRKISLNQDPSFYSIDLRNCPALTYFCMNYASKLSSMDFSGNPNIEEIYVRNAQLKSVNLRNCSRLRRLELGSNSLSNIDLSSCIELRHLDIFANQFTTINLSKNTKLTDFICDYNGFRFSTLPLNPITNLSAQNLKKIEFNVNYDDIIDFSQEHSVAGYTTRYWWTLHPNISTNVSMTDLGQGRFRPTPEVASKQILCRLYNDRFPGVFMSYVINVGKMPDEVKAVLADHLELDTKTTNNLYKAAPGAIFKIKAKVEANQSAVQIGLFKATNQNEFVEDITLTNYGDGNYDCKVVDTKSGDFIIAPYTKKLNTDPSVGVNFVNRPENSHLIDKLPLYVESASTRDWPIDDYYKFADHMKLLTNPKGSHVIELDTQFDLYASIPLDESYQLVAFLADRNGDFMSLVGRNAGDNIFDCMVLTNVDPGEYILVPAQFGSNGITVVTRPAGTQYMDRLPITVVAAPSTRLKSSVQRGSQKQLPLTVYPSPVVDNLHVKGLSESAKIEIYNMSGALVKSATVENENSIDIQTLSQGFYIVRITTASGGSFVTKIKKK